MSLLKKGVLFLTLTLAFCGFLSLFSQYPQNLLSTTSTIPGREDDLFQLFPHRTTYKLKNYKEKNGDPYYAKLPLHIPKGNFNIVGYYANLEKLAEQIKIEEGPYPGSADFKPLTLKTPSGDKGAYFVWLARYDEMDLGVYSEAVFCMAVVNRNAKHSSVMCHDQDLCLAEVFNQKHQFCYDLYLNSDLPIAYGIEILGTNKKRTEGEVTFTTIGNNTDDVRVKASMKNVLDGSFSADMNILAGLKLVPSLVNQMGLRKTFSLLWDTLNGHTLQSNIRFSRGLTTIYNSERFFTESFFFGKFKETAIQRWDEKLHKLQIHVKDVEKFDLKPAFVMTIVNARGVFLVPSIGEATVRE